jgi:hypothetical protein
MQADHKGDSADIPVSTNNYRNHRRSRMRPGIRIVAAVVLIVSLVCLGAVSCGFDSTVTPDDTEGPDVSEDIVSDDVVSNDVVSDDVTQSVGEREYRIEIAAIAVELIAIVNGMDQALADPAIEDPDWITSITLAMEDITTLCDEACNIVPPDSMADVHIINLEAIASLNDAMGILAEGIDENDIDVVNQASTEMWLAAEIMAEVTEVSE